MNRPAIRTRTLRTAIIIASCAIVRTAAAAAQDAPPPVAPTPQAQPQTPTTPPAIDPKEASEKVLISEIQRLGAPRKTNVSFDIELAVFHNDRLRCLAFIDQLLERYPHSMFRDEAIITKLRVQADLAMLKPAYLGELLRTIQALIKTEPRGRVAEELAYYEIRGFVLGARYEDMPRQRQLAGTLERYRAFLERFPLSPRAPIIWASFVRNLLDLDMIEGAEKALAEMKRRYPEHSATRRAAGELRRETGVGKPLEFEWTMPDGKPITSREFLGKVLLLHFWVSSDEQSVKDFERLKALRQKYDDADLALLGIAADPDYRRAVAAIAERNLTWPQHNDGQGLKNEIIVHCGVRTFPTYFYIDKKGTLRAIDAGEKLETTIDTLVAEQ